MNTDAAPVLSARGRLSLDTATLVVISMKDQSCSLQYDWRTELRVSPSAWYQVRSLAAATAEETLSHYAYLVTHAVGS